MNTGNDWELEVRVLIKRAEEEEQPTALDLYKQALRRIPKPIEESTYATQICIALGEIHFLQGNHEEALDDFKAAVRCKGGLGVAHIHLRLGQLRFERGEIERAKDELMRAYMGSGLTIFESEDPKYYHLIKDVIQRKRS